MDFFVDPYGLDRRSAVQAGFGCRLEPWKPYFRQFRALDINMIKHTSLLQPGL